MPGPARKGFNFHPPQLQPTDTNFQFTSIDALVRQAELGANTARIAVRWGHTNYQIADVGLPPIQMSVNGPYNYAQINYLKVVIDHVRENVNRDFSILAVVGGGPSDWENNVGDSRYSESQVGWDQFGRATAHIVNKLNENLNNFGDNNYDPPNRCIVVELYNEPNFTLGKYVIDENGNQVWETNGGATEVPSAMYGGMAAYLIYWLYHCCGGLTPSGDLKITPLFGALGLGGKPNSGTWVEEMKPTVYYDQFSFMTNAILGLLLQTDLELADKLRSAWRLSIHPYPRQFKRPTEDPPVDWPTNPDVYDGDRTGRDSADTVVDHYLDYYFIDRDRKIWITETGVSSNKVSEAGQRRFYERLGRIFDIRFVNNEDNLEGFIIFGLTDLDPAVCDPATFFYRFGVIRDTDGISRKPAANEVEFNFLNRWV